MTGLFAHNLGIDLGTYNTSIYSPNKGIILSSPSHVMYYNGKNIEYGHAAKVTIGKESNNMKIVRPLRYGVINDPVATHIMIKNFLKQARKNRFFGLIKPNILICVPASCSDAERKTIAETTYKAGASNVSLVNETICAALGAGFDMKEANGYMIMDLGGGTVNYGILSLGGMVSQLSMPLGGDELNEKIQLYVKKKFQINIGINTAEYIKHTIGNAMPDVNFIKESSSSINIVGTDVQHNPVEFTISSQDVYETISPILKNIADHAKKMIQQLQPELAGDIFKNGIYLTGAGSKLKNLDKFLTNEIKIRCNMTENPEQCVAIGTGKIFESFNEYKHLTQRY